MIGGPSGKCGICQCENGALPSEYVELTAKAVLEPNSSASARYRTGEEAGEKADVEADERGAYVFAADKRSPVLDIRRQRRSRRGD
ncbi:hypothetical protein TRAPUB_9961 [Trametes pubescens]|uniref:Uncharacterized protein n=1 Tax=Trametes pubescens TaxID=154538 RepID=A0A1M2W126_TRAPU|nr:hypothetical protein TRAPUB_9961 [Trametes pubescens]